MSSSRKCVTTYRWWRPCCRWWRRRRPWDRRVEVLRTSRRSGPPPAAPPRWGTGRRWRTAGRRPPATPGPRPGGRTRRRRAGAAAWRAGGGPPASQPRRTYTLSTVYTVVCTDCRTATLSPAPSCRCGIGGYPWSPRCCPARGWRTGSCIDLIILLILSQRNHTLISDIFEVE